MHRPRLFWRIYAAYLLVVILCTAAVGFYAVRSAHSFYIDHTERELLARAQLIRADVTPQLASDTQAQLQDLVRRLGQPSGTRITVIAGHEPGQVVGQVLADSEVADVSTMQNHANRPEVHAALQGGPGLSIRRSPTLGVDMMYVALPILQDGGTAAVVRAAVPLTAVNEALDSLYARIALSALVVAALAALLGVFLSRRISGQMRDIEHGAERFARGDFSHKLYVPRTLEFAVVAESLNHMAEDLSAQIDTLTRERNQREAVLTSMVEGVLAVDQDDRVIAVNEAAAKLLDVEPAAAEGRSIQEVVRNPDLQKVVEAALEGHEPVEADITMRVGAEDRSLQANGTLLKGSAAGDATFGAVVVLNDVTRLKRLEAVRRDFVANVSHELKTPVTSIKGFAETLDDGAIDDPEAAHRFVRIIAGQADRLNAIIGDLLALSSLEQSQDGRGLFTEDTDVCDVVRAAVEVCELNAQSKEHRHPRLVRRLRAGAGQPAAPRAGRRQPGRQRRQVQPRGQRGAGLPRAAGRRARDRRARRGSRHTSRAPAAAVRALLPRGQGPQPRPRRHGPRPRHRQTHRPGARRPRDRGERRGRGQHLPHPPAALLSAAAVAHRAWSSSSF